MNFTTKDRDYDRDYDDNCAYLYSGDWWYMDCHNSNLNGYYFEDGVSGYANGVAWYEPHGHYYSYKRTKMMIR